MKSFKEYNEENKREVIFTFGRFNPPTIGHGKLLAKVASLARGNDYRIYASQSNDAKKNPLEYKEKIKVMLQQKVVPSQKEMAKELLISAGKVNKIIKEIKS